MFVQKQLYKIYLNKIDTFTQITSGISYTCMHVFVHVYILYVLYIVHCTCYYVCTYIHVHHVHVHVYILYMYAVSSCQEMEFNCVTGRQCVNNSVQCDGNKDCDDGSDEYLCGE